MKKWGNKIQKVIKADVSNFSVKLQFTDGYTGTLYLSKLFGTPKGLAAELLRGNLFDYCFIEDGALAWPNGLELCPDAIRQEIDSKKPRKVA